MFSRFRAASVAFALCLAALPALAQAPAAAQVAPPAPVTQAAPTVAPSETPAPQALPPAAREAERALHDPRSARGRERCLEPFAIAHVAGARQRLPQLGAKRSVVHPPKDVERRSLDRRRTRHSQCVDRSWSRTERATHRRFFSARRARRIRHLLDDEVAPRDQVAHARSQGREPPNDVG